MKKLIAISLLILPSLLMADALTGDSKTDSFSPPGLTVENLTDWVPGAYDLCIHNMLLNGSDSLTVGEIRQQCANIKAPEQPLSKRHLSEVLTEKNPFVITPHRLNYAIFGHYTSDVNQTPFELQNPDTPLHYENSELQFQVSFKFPLAKKVIYDTFDVYAAYTNRSFWQFFDDKDSIPFRETNHEPELWAEFHANLDIFDFNLHKILIGVNHQSNGQSGLLSRGWNRVFVQGLLQRPEGYLSFKTWQRFEEDDEFDNSFDYAKYLGDYEIELGYRFNQHTLGMTLRNRYLVNPYGSVQLDYTYPLTKKIKGYVQWFNGYGDSLIDMDHHHNKIGIGVVLADRI
ncbi:phospholipase A [Thiomicrorhabdus sp. zzn3]|uniref:phospholipase A n=1 Tax=Thiomicrorhabdus sp. zzn3 TaxID=3039775 RepID=UPI0024364C38|nr:phospholipase A [Thiomicrorhabdus sp. zzn3]MDG6778862.1 phospholipase A [Thiomicrorhabdus sp. zzn3]